MSASNTVQPLSERYVRELREDHARFSRVLSMIGRDARRLVDAPDDALPMFAEAVDYVVRFQNVYHHPREEIMFDKIAEKSQQLAAIVTRLSQEHAGTAHAGTVLLSLIERASLAPEQREGRAQLARGLEKFARSMREHIDLEEDLLYSQVWTQLTEDDWERLIGSAAALDPLEDDRNARYPLLASYVSEGRTRSDVAIETSPLGEAVGSAITRVAKLLDGFGVITSTLKRQRKEACALTRKSVRALPAIPVLAPLETLEASLRSAAEFADAYGRWWREWSEQYRKLGTRSGMTDVSTDSREAT